jgi:hypothetical protein
MRRLVPDQRRPCGSCETKQLHAKQAATGYGPAYLCQNTDSGSFYILQMQRVSADKRATDTATKATGGVLSEEKSNG